jgi:hypothetical protein
LINLCISVSDTQIRLFCFILGRSTNSFSVKVERDKKVKDLCDAIIVKAELATNNFQIFKVHYQLYEDGWDLISLEAAPTRFCCRASSCSRNECRMAKVIHR